MRNPRSSAPIPGRLIPGFLSLATVMVLAGCSAPIRAVDDVHVARETGLGRLAFGDYWEASGIGRQGDTAENPRLAVASFTVEFVTDRVERRGSSGPRNFTTDFSGAEPELAEHLFDLFMNRHRELGHPIASLEDVTASTVYAEYPSAGPTDLIDLTANPEPRNAGAVRRITVCTVPGLHRFDPTADGIAALDARLRDDLEVDRILHVRIRVGIWRGHALLEDGCVLVVHPPEGRTVTVRSTRALASSRTALVNRDGSATTEDVYQVRASAFSSAVDTIFPTYASLATEVIRR